MSFSIQSKSNDNIAEALLEVFSSEDAATVVAQPEEVPGLEHVAQTLVIAAEALEGINNTLVNKIDAALEFMVNGLTVEADLNKVEEVSDVDILGPADEVEEVSDSDILGPADDVTSELDSKVAKLVEENTTATKLAKLMRLVQTSSPNWGDTSELRHYIDNAIAFAAHTMHNFVEKLYTDAGDPQASEKATDAAAKMERGMHARADEAMKKLMSASKKDNWNRRMNTTIRSLEAA
jgi:hypothetical protein